MTRPTLVVAASLAASLLGTACDGASGPAVDAPAVDSSVPPVAATPVEGRVVVLVVPGVDPDLVERWRSDLPAFERLMPGRNIPRLLLDSPGASRHTAAQLSTGLRRGGHGRLDGAVVDAATMQVLSAATADLRGAAPPFWELAARAGVPTRALWVPGGLPAEPIEQLWVVPSSLAATRPTRSIALLTEGAVLPPGADMSATVQLQGTGPWTVTVPLEDGNTWPLDLSQPTPATWRLSSGGVQADVHEGEVGPPVRLELPQGAGGGAFLVRLAAAPAGEGTAVALLAPGVAAGGDVAVTSPPALAEEWTRYHGPVDTTGGADAMLEALRAGLLTPDAFNRELQEQLDDRKEALAGELGRRDARLVVAWLPEAGLAAEAFLGLADSGHPGWSAERAARYGGTAKSAVARLDLVVGEVRAALQPGDRLVVVSDHGVGSVRAHVDLNAALADAGLLALQPGVDRNTAPLLDRAARWAGTTAYATGAGYVYLNAAGRQRDGIVPPARLAREQARVAGLLAGIKDGPKAAVSAVSTGAEVFPDAPEGRRPDLVVRFAEGFGPAPAMVAGRVGPAVVGPNRSPVTGGFAGGEGRDAAGFVVTTFGEPDADAHAADLGPTVLRLLGLADAPGLAGEAWNIAGPAAAVAAPGGGAPGGEATATP